MVPKKIFPKVFTVDPVQGWECLFPDHGEVVSILEMGWGEVML